MALPSAHKLPMENTLSEPIPQLITGRNEIITYGGPENVGIPGWKN